LCAPVEPFSTRYSSADVLQSTRTLRRSKEFVNNIFMGQQISYVGDQNLEVVRERGLAASIAQVDYGYLSSRVEKLVKLAQSSLTARVHDRSRPSQNTNVRHQYGEPAISSPTAAAENTRPLRFTDISAVDLSFDGDEYGVTVPDVLLEPVRLYRHVPMRKGCEVHTSNIGCHAVDKSCRNTDNSFEHLFTETSLAKAESFNPISGQVPRNENDVSESQTSLNRRESRIDANMRVYDAECQCRSRPPQSPKLITTPATVLQSAHESRPPEIGSYLAVAPVVSSSDLGLSPIDETAEVAATASLFCQTYTSHATAPKSLNCHTSSGVFSSGTDHTRLRPSMNAHNEQVSHRVNPAVSSFDNNTNFSRNPVKAKTTVLQSDREFLKTECSNNRELLRTVNDVPSVGKFSEDACHSPVSTYFPAFEIRNDESIKCSKADIRNTAHFGSLALQDAMFGDTRVTEHADSNIRAPCGTVFDGQCHLSESKVVAAASYPEFSPEDGRYCSPQTSTPYFVLADTVNLSENKDVMENETVQCNTCFVHHVRELDVPTAVHGRNNIYMPASDPVWTEWETALSCCDWSANNNESSSPEASRVKVSPAAGPLIARRQVRHSSDSSAPLSSSFPSAGLSNSSNQYHPLAARSISQLSLDDVIVSPRAVPERLDFQRLEKFEGGYSVVC